MNLKYKLLFFFLLNLIGTRVVVACSCQNPPTFCQATDTGQYVVSARVLTKSLLFMQIVTIEKLHKNIGYDTLTIVGQDGLNCNESLSYFSVNDTCIFALYKAFKWQSGTYFGGDTMDLLWCGPHFLVMHDTLVTGPISTGVSQQGYIQFKANLFNCLNTPMWLTGIKTDHSDTDLLLYPNPVTDNLTLSSEMDLSHIEVYSDHGNLVKTADSNAKEINLDLSSFPPGIYTIKLLLRDGIAYRKFVKM